MDSQDITTPRISIVIPSMRHLEDCLIPCLESIKLHTDLTDIEVVVVLNGCGDDGSREFVRRMGHPFKVVWLDEPGGYTHSINVGIHAAKGQYLILLNNDVVILAPHWIDMLLQPFLEGEKVGLTGPLMLHCPDADEDFLVFFCAMISRECLDSIGGQLDEAFQPGYGEDCCAAIEARRAGWKVLQVPPTQPQLVDKGCEDLPQWKRDKMWHNEFPIYHDGNKTFGEDHERFEVVLRKNKKILQERYGKKEKEVNTPTNNCEVCGTLNLDGVCIPCLKTDEGIDIFEASVTDGWFAVDECAQLARWVKECAPNSLLISIGEWHGRSTRAIAANLPEGCKLMAIDTWVGSSGEDEMHATAHLDRGDHAHQWWWCNLNKYIMAGQVIPVRMHSENAAETFKSLQEKGELDKASLIFVDADHSLEGFKTDIVKWSPTMKDGALWCGHDYYPEGEEPFAWIGVRQGVQDLFPDAQKAATSLWWSRSKPRLNPHQPELDYQIQSQCDDPEYAVVVERSQREILATKFADINKAAAVLDVGCGKLRMLQESGFTNVTSIDIIDAPSVIKCDMHALTFPDNSFDVVYASHSLEHAYDPLKVLSEFRRVLRPNGRLLLVLPYPDVIYDEHRAKAHCGSEVLGLTVNDGAKKLIETIEAAGFENAYREQGNLRDECEIYLKFEMARSRVYDCFIFNDEFDVLEIRLATLNDTVDRFVLCEGTLTHSGNQKPLHFDENKERFAKYLDKITHIVVDDYPEVEGTIYDQAWARERHQRDAILIGLQDCKPNDIILIGDADEIASSEAIKSYDPSQGLCRLKQRLFYYYLNCENKEGWDWQKICSYKTVKELTPCGVRYPPAGNTPLIESGGFHFSFLGNAQNAIKKVSDYAHREFDTPELMNIERVEKLISEGKDIFGRDDKYEFVEIDEGYPQYVRDNISALTEKGLIHNYLIVNPLAWHKPLTLPADLSAAEEMDAVKNWVEGASNVVNIDRPTSLRSKKHWTVTAEISTKDRYETTLPLAISAIITQTRKPDKLVIYDDGELTPEQLAEKSPFKGLFGMCDEQGIPWEVFDTPKQGQVANHQHALDTASTDFILRVDDDLILMPDCLERLLNTIRDYGNGGEYDTIGAVAPLIHHPGAVNHPPAFVNGSMDDVRAGVNLQWYDWDGGTRETSHLYSSFLYRVDAARKAGGYPKTLSQIGHREETIFSHGISRAGFKLVVTPWAKAYHLRENSGGIRSFNDPSLWEHDEKVFQSYLTEWGMNSGKPTKLIVLDCGIGDHFAFKSILPKLREIHADKELVLSVCFPSVFDGENLKLISIADAKTILGERYESSHLYRALWEQNNQLPLADAMLKFWG